MRIKLYVEGGGDDNDALRTACRKGFRTLIEKAGLAGCMPRIVACGSRTETFNKFRIAARSAAPDEFMCLLVDSEDPVADGTSPWAFLGARQADQWEKPAGTPDENAHLMVQCMEAWFLADPDAVERFFGRGFRRNALPNRADVEKIPKDGVETALEGATRACATKGQYHKGRHSFALLATLDHGKVAASSPYAARLFETLRRKAQVTPA
ncbi:MAG: DUF4276 family protein [Bryobacteraceae bacterium]